jgi:hypothetical protein
MFLLQTVTNKQTALIVIMAQIGYFVPAKHPTAHVKDLNKFPKRNQATTCKSKEDTA